MSYEFLSVDKPDVAGAGAGSPKSPNVFLVRTKRVLQWPVRNSKGVLAIGDLIFQSGYNAISVYMTGVNQKPNFAIEGEVDKEQIMQKFEATHPGDELEAAEFFQNNLGEDLVIFYKDCDKDTYRQYGTPCSPLRMKGSFEDAKEGKGYTFSFEQIQATRFVPAFYNGNIPLASPTDTDVTVLITKATDGLQYKIESLDTTAAISISSTDLVAGDVVSFIGSGGADPATLATGASTGVTVLLADGQTWTALENATISFDVFDDGSTLYLIEKNRS